MNKYNLIFMLNCVGIKIVLIFHFHFQFYECYKKMSEQKWELIAQWIYFGNNLLEISSSGWNLPIILSNK